MKRNTWVFAVPLIVVFVIAIAFAAWLIPTANGAYADTIIDQVDLTLYTVDTQGLRVNTDPKAGNKLADFSLTTANNNEDYYVSGFHWLDTTADEEYVSPGNVTFVGGHTYELRANIKINNYGNAEAKYFLLSGLGNPDVTVKINGSASGITTSKNPGRDAKTFFWMIYEFNVPAGEVDTIKITNVVEPVGGEAPTYDFTVTGGKAHKNTTMGTSGAEWLDIGANSGMDGKKFEAFKQYKFTMYVELDEGFLFKTKDQVSVFVNGQEVNDFSINEENKKTMIVNITYTCQDTPHAVTFKRNGGNGSDDIVRYAMGEYALPTAAELGITPANASLEFAHWYVVTTQKVVRPGNKINVTEDITVQAEWKGVFHTISFNAGTYGDGTMQSVKVLHGQSYTLPECVFTSNSETYEFDKWERSSDLSQTAAGQQVSTIEGDEVFTALWASVPTYNVIIDPNGAEDNGEMDAYEGQQLKYYTLPDCYYATGPIGADTFVGWAVNDLAAEPKPAGEKITLAEETTLYAIWADNDPVTITYDSGETQYSYLVPEDTSVEIKSFDELGFEPPVGKRFVCWYDNFHKNDTYSVGDSFAAKDMYFMAKYEETGEIVYTVTINGNGGEGDQITFDVLEGTEYTLPVCTFGAPEGELFKAWDVLSVEYQPGSVISVTENTIISAKWYHPVGLVVDYSAGVVNVGGVLDTAYLYVAVEYDDGTVEDISYTDVDYYEGIFNDSDDLAEVTEDDVDAFTFDDEKRYEFTIAKGDFLAYFVVYAKTQYLVSFDANGGTGTMDDEYVWSGDSYVIPYATFVSPAEKVFKCWDMGEEEEVLYVYPGTRLDDVDADIELKAVWVEPFQATITFDSNGGTGDMDPVAWDGFVYVLPACTFVAPEGMVFRAWAYDGKEYAAEEEIFLDEDVTVTAVWGPEEQDVEDQFMAYEENGKMYYAFDFVKKSDLDLSQIVAAAAEKGWGVRISVNGELFITFDAAAVQAMKEPVDGFYSGVSVDVAESKDSVPGSLKSVWINLIGQTDFGEGKATVMFFYDEAKAEEGKALKVIRTDALGVSEEDIESDVWSGNATFTANSLPYNSYYVLVEKEEDAPAVDPADPSDTPVPPSDTPVPPSDAEGSLKGGKLSGGAIAGIVIGSVFGALLIACAVLFLLQKKGVVKIAFLAKLLSKKPTTTTPPTRPEAEEQEEKPEAEDDKEDK